jgi:hypothetical protein
MVFGNLSVADGLAAPRQEHAAEAFDVACLKAKGHKAKLNFPLARYQELLPFLATVSMEARTATSPCQAPHPHLTRVSDGPLHSTEQALVMSIRRCGVFNRPFAISTIPF